MVSETVEAEGHLIDSGNFQSILTTIVEHGSEYEILRFEIGRTNAQGSHLTLKLTAATDERLQDLLSKLSVFGCYVKGTPEATLRPADMDGAAPEDFYSTTNHRTSVFLTGAWVAADEQRMDGAFVLNFASQAPGPGPGVSQKKLRDIRKGDPRSVACRAFVSARRAAARQASFGLQVTVSPGGVSGSPSRALPI